MASTDEETRQISSKFNWNQLIKEAKDNIYVVSLILFFLAGSVQTMVESQFIFSQVRHTYQQEMASAATLEDGNDTFDNNKTGQPGCEGEILSQSQQKVSMILTLKKKVLKGSLLI